MSHILSITVKYFYGKTIEQQPSWMLASIFEKGVIKFSCNFDLAQAGVQNLRNAELFTVCLVVLLLLFAFHDHSI